MRVLFWGTPEFAVPALRALGDEGHDVVAAVTQPDRPAGRGRAVAASPVKRVARDEAIPVLQPGSARDPSFLADLRELDAEVSVVVAYGQILPVAVLGVPRLGSINIHASLLPELRGAAPIHWAILRGYETTGVTIMRMEAGLDSGPILHQVAEPIRPEESMSELSQRLAEIGAEAMVEALAMMESGAAREVEQDHARATYAPKLSRETAHIDWGETADGVSRRIRAFDAVPGAWTTLDGAPIKLFGARAEQGSGAPGEVLHADDASGVLIAAGEGAVRVRGAQPAGRRRMTAAEWVRGRGVREGARFL